MTVRVTGDDVEVDLTGSSPQVPTAFNVPFDGSTKVACYFAFRALLLDTYTHQEYIPQNEGSFRPVKVTAPLGSIFNPIAPAACEARFNQIQRVVDLIIKALAPVLPDKCTAGNAACLSFAAYSGVRPSGDYWVFLEVNEGAYGGRPRSDGPDCIDNLMANTRNNPLEDLAMHIPMICDRYELRDDLPPGAGEFRGGIGVVKVEVIISVLSASSPTAAMRKRIPPGSTGTDTGTMRRPSSAATSICNRDGRRDGIPRLTTT